MCIAEHVSELLSESKSSVEVATKKVVLTVRLGQAFAFQSAFEKQDERSRRRAEVNSAFVVRMWFLEENVGQIVLPCTIMLAGKDKKLAQSCVSNLWVRLCFFFFFFSSPTDLMELYFITARCSFGQTNAAYAIVMYMLFDNSLYLRTFVWMHILLPTDRIWLDGRNWSEICVFHPLNGTQMWIFELKSNSLHILQRVWLNVHLKIGFKCQKLFHGALRHSFRCS